MSIWLVGKSGELSQYFQKNLHKSGYTFYVSSVAEIDAMSDIDRAVFIKDNAISIVLLCVIDFSSPQYVEKFKELPVMLVDVSPEYRTHSEWEYFNRYLTTKPSKFKKISLPGCFATSVILILKPLLVAGLISPDKTLLIDSTGGRSVGGNGLRNKLGSTEHTHIFNLKYEHRHVKEIQHHLKLTGHMVFHPKIGNFDRGIHTVMYFEELNPDYVLERYTAWYKNDETVAVAMTDANSLYLLPDCDQSKVYVIPETKGCSVVSNIDNLAGGSWYHLDRLISQHRTNI